MFSYHIRKMMWCMILLEKGKLNESRKGYMECILVDDTKLEFDKLCTTVREFDGGSYDKRRMGKIVIIRTR